MANRFLDLLGLGAPSSNGALVVSENGHANGNGKHAPAPIEAKDVQFVGDERRFIFINGANVDPDDATTWDVRGRRAYIAAALAYICIRYRAQKLREAPLMVVEESDEGEEWIQDHELNPLLARPNPDYRMGRLIEATETYLCLTGRCLWVKNRDRQGRVAMLYPFSGDEFTIRSTPGRLFGEFTVNGKTVKPEDAIYHSYFSPTDPLGGAAPLDAALAHLNIGQQLAARVRKHLQNAMTPGAIYVADKDWRATDDEFARLKGELNAMFQGANSGKTAIAEGGGKIERGFTLKELQLGEMWREVEATVCGVFNVPASLVGTVVGLENSPWSHLETAKRSFYDECVLPEWELLEGPITDSLLREVDDDPTHLIRFDTSRIRALQKDVAAASVVAATAQRWTSVNERRVMMGLKKIEDDPKADEIPELVQPVPPAPAPGLADAVGNDPAKRAHPLLNTKAYQSLRQAYADAITEEHAAVWELSAADQLHRDGQRLAEIAARELSRGKSKKESRPKDPALTDFERARDRVLKAMEAYLDGESALSWARMAEPIIRRNADAAMLATVVPDLGIDAQLLRPNLASFVRREAAFLVTNVTDTTKDAVRSALAETVDAEGVDTVATRIREATAFNRERAKLIARTESTRVLNGAPLEALQQYGTTTGQGFTKRWIATLDDKVREAHRAMHGETVPVDKPFSNGLMAPGEPNCRCALTYGVEGVAP